MTPTTELHARLTTLGKVPEGIYCSRATGVWWIGGTYLTESLALAAIELLDAVGYESPKSQSPTPDS